VITNKLIHPRSIAVIGASNDTRKPGGKVIENLLVGGFDGPIYPVNPKESEIQGIAGYRSVSDLPQVDVAILAIPAASCVETVRVLAETKETRGFIVFSAGFGEVDPAGAAIESEMVRIADAHGAALIGPNCIGILTPHYNGVFTTPIPPSDAHGCTLISGSGATAVFIMEASTTIGLRFSRVFSVGNSAQIGVEDVLRYIDETESGASDTLVPPILLYIESITDPQAFLTHARSLRRKGFPIAAIKAGSSEAGGRAAGSHTGALAGSDAAVDALFQKAGVIRCRSREELTTVGAVLSQRGLAGPNIAVVTHAGGPAVMMTDTLSEGGLTVPPISGEAAEQLQEALYPASSVGNPIDFLATGSAEQLRMILAYCENRFDNIDGIAVIFGSPGLFPVDDAYRVLHDAIRTQSKPIYPILPSVVNAAREAEEFRRNGNIAFPDEVTAARAIATAYHAHAPFDDAEPTRSAPGSAAPAPVPAPEAALAARIGELTPGPDGFLPPADVAQILDAVGIPRVPEVSVYTEDEAVASAQVLGYPIVMKAIGPVHKSDVGGVALGVATPEEVQTEFRRIMAIPETTAVLLQPMAKGTELFAGVVAEPPYGHLIAAGLGGIFVELLKDTACGLAPLGAREAEYMISSLNGYELLRGARGTPGVDITQFVGVLTALSHLVGEMPEIIELDLNPLIATAERIMTVDARIRIKT
jgi:acyl-CoA synthetase (NDP forming)